MRKTYPFSDTRDLEEARLHRCASVPPDTEDGGGVSWDIDDWHFSDRASSTTRLIRRCSVKRRSICHTACSRWYPASIKFAASTWPTSRSSRERPAGSSSIRYGKRDGSSRSCLREREAGFAAGGGGDHLALPRRHFGGIRGVVDDADLAAGKVQIIAPVGFVKEAIAENLFAGNAMTRRKTYTYGDLLPRAPAGHVDSSIGKATASGSTGLAAADQDHRSADRADDDRRLQVEFQNTPGTEAPAEMNTWFPDYKAFWGAENMVATQHNLLTLRGAPVRDALAWSEFINETLYRYGDQAEVLFTAHTWPRWGHERISEVMRGERDMYANLNNQVLHLGQPGRDDQSDPERL